jgi:hypothetical protein
MGLWGLLTVSKRIKIIFPHIFSPGRIDVRVGSGLFVRLLFDGDHYKLSLMSSYGGRVSSLYVGKSVKVVLGVIDNILEVIGMVE